VGYDTVVGFLWQKVAAKIVEKCFSPEERGAIDIV